MPSYYQRDAIYVPPALRIYHHHMHAQRIMTDHPKEWKLKAPFACAQEHLKESIWNRVPTYTLDPRTTPQGKEQRERYKSKNIEYEKESIWNRVSTYTLDPGSNPQGREQKERYENKQ